ncbi:hypothetical protein L208DRAFT_1409804 [Tricholoma matsutake]|nr:hypothetical protein L208DRAFT_1409804 [Tricholoma matsutake 945]
MRLRHHFQGLGVPPPALLSADLGLVSRAQSIVDWVETYNLWGGRPIVEGGWGVELQSKGKSHSFNHNHFFFSNRHKLSLPMINPMFIHQLCSSLTTGSLGAHAGSGSIEYHSGRKHISQSCKLERAW